MISLLVHSIAQVKAHLLVDFAMFVADVYQINRLLTVEQSGTRGSITSLASFTDLVSLFGTAL